MSWNCLRINGIPSTRDRFKFWVNSKIDIRFLIVTNGQSRFFRDLLISALYRNFGHINKACRKQSAFTGCVQLDVLQNKFLTENGFVPGYVCKNPLRPSTHAIRRSFQQNGHHIMHYAVYIYAVFDADIIVLR